MQRIEKKQLYLVLSVNQNMDHVVHVRGSFIENSFLNDTGWDPILLTLHHTHDLIEELFKHSLWLCLWSCGITAAVHIIALL